MKVKVHPNKTLVNNGSEACISITPDKKWGRAYYMGTAILSDVYFRVHDSGLARAQLEQVRNVHAWAVGELIHEAVEQNEPTDAMLDKMVQVTYHYDVGRFTTVIPRDEAGIARDLTDHHFRAAYMCGANIYVSKDGLL